MSTATHRFSADEFIERIKTTAEIIEDAGHDVPAQAKDLDLGAFEAALDSFINESEFPQVIQSLLEPENADKQVALIRQYFLDATLQANVSKLDGEFEAVLKVAS